MLRDGGLFLDPHNPDTFLNQLGRGATPNMPDFVPTQPDTDTLHLHPADDTVQSPTQMEPLEGEFPDSISATSGSSLGRFDLVRSLSLDHVSTESDTASTKFRELGISGNVISVNFCVPYAIKHGEGEEWELAPRQGTSALFDSFKHLSSRDSNCLHTLIGWTGEIEQIKPPGFIENSFTEIPLNKATAPIPVDESSLLFKPHDPWMVKVSTGDRKALVSKLCQEHAGRVHPVWLPEDTAADGTTTLRNQKKWRRYGDQVLSALFHYKESESSDGRPDLEAWQNYEKLNYAFADAVMSVYRPGDIVMIHDYHLLLLPHILRQRLPNVFLGLFLHIPFPTSEYFRTLPTREQLITGMLGADMIGFQTETYAGHFKWSCDRILDLRASEQGVDHNGTYTAFEVFPIGINATATLQSAFNQTIDNTIASLIRARIYTDRKVIVGRDRLDSARGVVDKLKAFQLFLETYPEWRGNAILVQVNVPPTIDQLDGQSDEIAQIVTRINGKFGHLAYTPVHCCHREYLPSDEYFALLRMADIGLITSIRDGMNTTALEYIVCQRDKKSPLIISEFSGTAESFPEDAISINPWDHRGVADAIHKALSMSESSKATIHDKLYHIVTENDVQSWTNKCINRLIANLIANNRYQRTPTLHRGDLVRQYSIANRRLFLFDYDGTLTPIVTDPADAIANQHTIHTLEKLASNPENAVWIISGRDQAFLDMHLGHISSLGLSAEHGSFMRAPDSTQWESLTEHMDLSWQGEAAAIFNRYSATAMGSFVEQKRIAVTWHYRQAEDPELAFKEAKKCQMELNQTLAKKYDVDIMAGKANVEVRPRFVNKGEIVKRLVQAYGEGEDCAPDFVLCLGDDSTDEDMFQKLRCSNLPPEQVFAVSVGSSRKPTLASSYVSEPADVIAILDQLNYRSEGRV